MFAAVAVCVCVCVWRGVRQHYYLCWTLSAWINGCIRNCAVHTHTHIRVSMSCFATQIITQHTVGHICTQQLKRKSQHSHHSQMVWWLGCVCTYIYIVFYHCIYLACTYNIQDVHNLLQFLVQGQIYTRPRGTASLWDYRPKRHSEGMSYHSHPSQISCLQIVSSGTRHIQGIHHRQQGEGQWLNPVYMISI